jgi:hypothetical protein
LIFSRPAGLWSISVRKGGIVPRGDEDERRSA